MSDGLESGAAPAPDAIGHYLVAIGGAEPGRRVEVGSPPLTIGRQDLQSLVFAADSEVSRLHARVSLINGEAVAEDMGSTNGTFVDAERITGPTILREGSVIRVGRQLLKYERRSRRDVAQTQQLDRDLRRASDYVLSLLPAPIAAGPVWAEWCLHPSAQLGGDAFGYFWLDASTFVFYLLDVSGHGVGSAMHSVTVMNVLRQRALPGVDFGNPAEVLASLNDRFQMESHHGMYFTMWYGAYRRDERILTYASAGHHPAYLLPPDRTTMRELGTPAFMVGAMAGCEYGVEQTTVEAGSAIYLFSDGVFEISTADQQWTLQDFLPLLLEPAIPGTSEPDRLHRAVTRAADSPLEDDFSVMVVTCP